MNNILLWGAVICFGAQFFLDLVGLGAKINLIALGLFLLALSMAL